jgi:hypothetical protein
MSGLEDGEADIGIVVRSGASSSCSTADDSPGWFSIRGSGLTDGARGILTLNFIAIALGGGSGAEGAVGELLRDFLVSLSR